ncbi:MAG: DNA-binding protein [Nitrospirae bacterium]|nr:MAG: DNA-binding protein [Nitrospirota bacterium]
MKDHPPKDKDCEVMDIAPCAAVLGLSEKAVRYRVSRRQLPFRRWGRRVIFLRSELMAFLNDCLQMVLNRSNPMIDEVYKLHVLNYRAPCHDLEIVSIAKEPSGISIFATAANNTLSKSAAVFLDQLPQKLHVLDEHRSYAQNLE